MNNEVLNLNQIHESGISSHGVHITGAVSICKQLLLYDTLTQNDERAVFFLGNLAWYVECALIRQNTNTFSQAGYC